MESKKEEEKPLAGTRIEDPRERLVNRVASCMIKEPNFTKGNTSDRVVELVQDLVEVLDVDPEFISQLAYYARNTLNLRSVSNFLIAYASQNELSREYLGPYFTGTVRLPTDLLQIVEFQMQISAATRGGSGKINTCLRKLVKKKFGEFNLYQMGKYCSEGRRKRAMKKAAAAKKLLCGEETKETKAKAKKLNMKQLVRLCHIQEPAETVMSILGKHYPSSWADFMASPLWPAKNFDSTKAGQRMKIPTPTTWETELSERGNRPEVWEKLIHTGSGLPYMALLRNLRNIIKAGVNDDTHEKVQFTVQDPERVISSRQFPIRWLAAFDVLRQIGQEMQRKPEDQPEEVKKKRSFTKNRKLIPCPNPPTKDLLIRYKDALDSAIKVATTENVSPIPGNTVIFCDVSGSMAKPVNGGSGLGAFNDGRRIGILMGLMLRFVSETSDFKIFSSPKDNSESYLTVDIEGDDILGNMNNVLKQMTKLGTATHFPFSYFTDLIEHSKHIDTFIIISDMMIAPGRYELGKLQWNVSSILNFYRKSVNPDLLFVSIDVGSSGRKILGAELEDDFRNVLISGYSDAILRLVSEMQNSQVETIKETAYEYLEKKTKS